ncbi:hypothetical protein ACFFS2_31915 [Streptomyces aurantiacus]|uniref:Uncharacterized protein n=1 Tax=Streptomyces aurantiacus TaxID=47760 RepID=A0A7G1NW00_9ACTN|nr:hypothetical protein [Streptomyces aurantiacus]BCL27563.1 hypothetical protein GCM10017557_24220 [Streptomyces aurantiacus]
MTHGYTTDDAEAAARLVAFALRPRVLPSRDGDYLDLAQRYRRDDAFRTLTDRIGRGLGLKALGSDRDTAAVVLAALDGSVFETKMDDYAKRAKYRGERGDTEKVLHGIIHLAIAALAFPRPDDLAQDGYIGRISVSLVDATVRDTCHKLQKKAAEGGEETDTPTETPELEKVWHAYSRRPEASRTKDERAAPNSTKAMVGRALNFLTDSGFLTVVGDPREGNYRTTPRYQLQVRELAATNAFNELLKLNVVPLTDSSGTLRVVVPTLRDTQEEQSV